MANTRDADRSKVGALRSQVGWLLVLLVGIGGVLLALNHVSLWLVFAGGALTTGAIVALVRPDARDATTGLVLQAETGWTYLRTELARSRRHDRRFAVVGIPDDVWSPPGATGAEKAELALQVAANVQDLIRRPDRAWMDNSRLHLLLTDCDRQEGLAFLARARAAMPQVFADERVKLVVFPDDGITSGALIAGLDGTNVPVVEREPSGGGVAAQ